MKKINVILTALTLFGLMTGCGGSGGGNTNENASDKTQTDANADTHGITMTIKPENGDIRFYIGGNGVATIDWGDDSPVETATLTPISRDEEGYPSENNEFKHTYAQSVKYTIKITGENITEIMSGWINLTDLDVSKNPALTTLDCSENQLTTIDVSKNTALKTLRCNDNRLTDLDVSKNAALTSLDCSGNRITNLDISKNAALKYLSCSGNQLTGLDVSKNTAMESLSCGENPLTKLDVSQLPALKYLWCTDNQLTDLEVSKNTLLTRLGCGSNPLTKLDMSKNTKLTFLNCYNNQLSTEALNALFQTLCTNTGNSQDEDDYSIYLDNNPGTKTCNRSIAQKKGWKVD